MSGLDFIARALGFERAAKALTNERIDTPYAWPVWRENTEWTPSTLAGYTAAGYQDNAIVYACIARKAESAAFAPLVAYTGERDEPERLPDEEPFAQLLLRPNKYQSWYEFAELLITYLELDGNVFVYKQRTSMRSLDIAAMWPLRPDRVRPVPQGGQLLGYVYEYDDKTKPPETYLPEEVIHVKYPNPADPFDGLGRGSSPLSAAAKATDVDNSATSFLKTFFDNAVVPFGLLKTKQTLMDPEVKRIRERLRAQYGGSRSWGDVMILDADAEYQRLGLTMQELAFDALDARNEARICLVPGTMIVTKRGLVPIEQVAIGDEVVTHRGRWQRVSEVMANEPHDFVCQITANGLDPLCATGNHPVYAAEYQQSRTHRVEYVTTDWVSAGDLQPKRSRGNWHALTIPQLNLDQCADLQLADWIKGRRFSVLVDDNKLIHPIKWVQPLPSVVPMSAALGRLVGFYLAEGSQGSGKLLFYFHADETELQQQVIQDLHDVFGVEANVVSVQTPNVAMVCCQNAMLTELFDCGTALTKRLPAWAWQGGSEFFSALLNAWVAGDGCTVGDTTRGCTGSIDLAWQMRLIAIACGHTAGLTSWQQRPSSIQGRALRSESTMYIVSWQDKATRRKYRLDDGNLSFAIRKAEPLLDYRGPVYNLEVEEDHSYLTTGGMVHNCMVLKVPAIIAGAKIGLDRSTFANYSEARSSFWEDSLIPGIYKRFEDGFSGGLSPHFQNQWCAFDYSDVPALREDITAKVDAAVKLYTSGVGKLNEARALAGLGPLTEEDEDGFKPEPQPVIVQPAQTQPEQQEEETDESMEPEEAGKQRKQAELVGPHNGVYREMPCPLCRKVGVDVYEDHGGLCVCRNCHKTFDPAIEMLEL